MSSVGYQNNTIYVNFHLQKSFEIFEKNSAYKIWSKKDKGIKLSLPVPNRVQVGIRTLVPLVWLQLNLEVNSRLLWYIIQFYFFLHWDFKLQKCQNMYNWILIWQKGKSPFFPKYNLMFQIVWSLMFLWKALQITRFHRV